MSERLSSRKAAQLYGVTNDYIARLCRAGKLHGSLDGRTWWVEPQSLEKFFATRGKSTRPGFAAGELLTSREAAKRYRVTNDYIARLAKQGKLRGTFNNGLWKIERASLDEFFAPRREAVVPAVPLVDAPVHYTEASFIKKVFHAVPTVKARLVRDKRFSFAAGILALMLLANIVALLGAAVQSSSPAALARVESPFFSGGIVSKLFSFFFGAEGQGEAATTTPRTYQASAYPAPAAGPTGPIVQNFYQIAPRAGDSIPTDTLVVMLGELYRSTNAEIKRMIGATLDSKFFSASSAGITTITDADVPDTITASNYLPLAGGTLTGALTGTNATFDNATTSSLAISGTASTTNLVVSSLGAAAGSCLSITSTGSVTTTSCGSSAAFPFTPTSLGNATSTLIQLTAGLISNASSTIGGGTQTTGLTISGGATTTGNAYFGGNLGLGTTSPATTLSVTGNGYLTGGLGVGLVNTTSGTIQTSGSITSGSNVFVLATGGYVGGNPNYNVTFNSGQTDLNASSHARINFDTTNTGTGEFQIFKGATNGAGTRLLTITNAGNVGISDSSPASLFTVGNGDLFQVDSSGRLFLPAGASGAGNLALSTTGDTNTGLYFSGADEIRFQTGGSDRLTINASGNVGIGTTTPQWLLNPTSATAAQLSLSAGGGIAQWAFRNAGGNLYLATTTVAGTATTTVSALTITGASGNVGIGTTSPSYKLSVSGDINFTGKLLEDGSEVFATMIAPFAGSCPTGWSEYTAARGRTVVGTPSSGTNAGTVGTALTNLGTRTITDVAAHTHTVDPPSTNTSTDGAHTHTEEGVTNGSGGTDWSTTGNDLRVNNQNTGSAGNHSHTVNIAQFNSGSTGVASVDVTMPYIQLTYCQKTAGADLAEWVPASEPIAKASIVSVDPNNRERVVASRSAYDTAVVGIVATQPGWLIGQEAKGSVQLALAGRVPLRVSLKNGEIRPGDPITTSGIPGVGMRATESGPIVGKAMEALNETSALNSCLDPTTGLMEQCGEALVFVNVSWYAPGAGSYATDSQSGARMSGTYYETLSLASDFEEGDIATLSYAYAQVQGDPQKSEKTARLRKAAANDFTVGAISKRVNGPGDLLRRTRSNNQITEELRLVTSGKADMKIAPDSAAIAIGDPIVLSQGYEGMGTKATAAGPIIARALEEWYPGSGKKTITVLVGQSWYSPAMALLDAHASQHQEAGASSVEPVPASASFWGELFNYVVAWLADAGNGIADLFATTIHAETVYAKKVQTEELCVGAVCVSEEEFLQLVDGRSHASEEPPAATSTATSTPENGAGASAGGQSGDQAVEPAEESSDQSASTTPTSTDTTGGDASAAIDGSGGGGESEPQSQLVEASVEETPVAGASTEAGESAPEPELAPGPEPEPAPQTTPAP